MQRELPVTVVEVGSFLRTARTLMDETEYEFLVDFLAYNPLAGDLVPGTGGLRKLRWGLEGRGKRGGARIVYYFHDLSMPLFALAAFAKNEKSDLNQDARKEFTNLIDLLVAQYKGRRKS